MGEYSLHHRPVRFSRACPAQPCLRTPGPKFQPPPPSGRTRRTDLDARRAAFGIPLGVLLGMFVVHLFLDIFISLLSSLFPPEQLERPEVLHALSREQVEPLDRRLVVVLPLHVEQQSE